uniref:Protein FAM160A1-like n=1 Tax=Saccoglossus kowalevskii TaxID=10224 RepID=A0ABM0M0T8_SACKO|nr:PREDICTED: protein FAM160A1-like [Saccoglossus kowalevskii]
MSWYIENNHPDNGKYVTFPESEDRIIQRPNTSDLDPYTCYEVFKMHWRQVQSIIYRQNTTSGLFYRPQLTADEVQTVVNYVDQMMALLIAEKAGNAKMGPILEAMLTENVMEKLFLWSSRSGQFVEELKFELLKIYEMIIGQSRQRMLTHQAILNPLLRLLLAASDFCSQQVESHLILLLNQLCVCLTQDPSLLDFLFHASPDVGPAKFLIFSLLIPYLHRDGPIGQQARDALLLCMSVSSGNELVGSYIAESTNFCPVLATGLSGLYSALPHNIPHSHKLTRDDANHITSLAAFLNSLDFCNAVVQVAHPRVCRQLVDYVYDGFLLPVMAPALHQNVQEEVIAATTYLDLFIRCTTEPLMMRAFLRFICKGHHEGSYILDTLISRIHSETRLCTVTLSLFYTLLNLNCEDVVLHLVLKKHSSLLSTTSTMVSRTSHDEYSNSFVADNTEENYFHYLIDSRKTVEDCYRSCLCWSNTYDGRRRLDSGTMSSQSSESEFEWWQDADEDSNSVDNFEDDLSPRESHSSESSDDAFSDMGKFLKTMFGEDVDNNDEEEESEFTITYLEEWFDNLYSRKEFLRQHSWSSSVGLTSQSMDNYDEDNEWIMDRWSQRPALDSVTTMDEESVEQNSINNEESEKKIINANTDELYDFWELDAHLLPPASLRNHDFDDFADTNQSDHPSSVTGPFISALFARLEHMIENPVEVNLLLTAVISRLGSYPQILLSSFLLNTELVFQPSVRSLLQVLISVKSNIEMYAYRTDTFSSLVSQARLTLTHGDQPVNGEKTRGRTLSKIDVDSNARPKAPKKSGISDFFLRRGSGRRQKSIKAKEKQKLHAIQGCGDNMQTKYREVANAAIIFEEFLKELAAISQEHAVLQGENLQFKIDEILPLRVYATVAHL